MGNSWGSSLPLEADHPATAAAAMAALQPEATDAALKVAAVAAAAADVREAKAVYEERGGPAALEALAAATATMLEVGILEGSEVEVYISEAAASCLTGDVILVVSGKDEDEDIVVEGENIVSGNGNKIVVFGKEGECARSCLREGLIIQGPESGALFAKRLPRNLVREVGRRIFKQGKGGGKPVDNPDDVAKKVYRRIFKQGKNVPQDITVEDIRVVLEVEVKFSDSACIKLPCGRYMANAPPTRSAPPPPQSPPTPTTPSKAGFWERRGGILSFISSTAQTAAITALVNETVDAASTALRENRKKIFDAAAKARDEVAERIAAKAEEANQDLRDGVTPEPWEELF